MDSTLLTVEITLDYLPEIDGLRKICFPHDYPGETCKDEFDDRSDHILVRIDGKLAGYGRLTPGPGLSFITGLKDWHSYPMAQTPWISAVAWWTRPTGKINCFS